ncbi:MAG TPA: iron-containing alcohol dehydrogenase, partial [Alphaproteobacteria bacterium]|nr:iron-containing alcohol dehydrogenase [Alphaproteobacteria bacterium]
AVARPGDLAAREAILRAACLAGFAIDACGTAVAHAIGHALGAIGHVHHGRAVGLALRVALAGNARAAPEAHARIAGATGLDAADDAALAAALPAAFDAFLRRVGLDIGLGADGLGPADADRLTEATLRPENRPMLEANCRPLQSADVASLAAELLRAT